MSQIKLSLDLVPQTSWWKSIRVAKRSWLNCDEIWDYKNGKQILIGLRAICRMCHLTKHMGFATVIGLEQEAFNHLLKVNNWKEEKGLEHVKLKFQEREERSKNQWVIDYSYLKDKINL